MKSSDYLYTLILSFECYVYGIRIFKFLPRFSTKAVLIFLLMTTKSTVVVLHKVHIFRSTETGKFDIKTLNPLNTELNPICQ